MKHYYAILPRSDYISHHGKSKLDGAEVGSGRYPLGSGDRPYQRYEESDRFEPKTDSEYLAAKQRALLSGSAADIRPYIYDLSNKELEQAIQRIKWMDTLSQSEKKAKKSSEIFKSVDNFMNNVDKVYRWGNIAMKTYKGADAIIRLIDTSIKLMN